MRIKIKRLFTLIELIVVIVVLGILAAIVIPNVANVKEDSITASIQSNTRNLQTGVDLFKLNNDGDVPSTEKVELGKPQFVDIERLNPHYIRNNPKDKAYYMVDSWGIVWGSKVLPPSNFKNDGTALKWDKVERSSGYNIYELPSATTGAVNESGLKLVDSTANTTITPKGYSASKEYFVSAIDKKGFETASVIEGYELPEIPAFYQENFNPSAGKPVEVSPFTPSTMESPTVVNYPISTSFFNAESEGNNIRFYWKGKTALFNPATQTVTQEESFPTGNYNFEVKYDSNGNRIMAYGVQESSWSITLEGKKPDGTKFIDDRGLNGISNPYLVSAPYSVTVNPVNQNVLFMFHDAGSSYLKSYLYDASKGYQVTRGYLYASRYTDEDYIAGKAYYDKEGNLYYTYFFKNNYNFSFFIDKIDTTGKRTTRILNDNKYSTHLGQYVPESTLVEDSEGRLWIATETYGNNSTQFNYYVVNKDLTIHKGETPVFSNPTSTFVSQPSMVKDSNNNVWLFYLQNNSINYVKFTK